MEFVNRVATNVDELMSGNPSILIGLLSEIDRENLAYAEHVK